MMGLRRVARSFRFALAGIAYVVRTQPNARLHVLLAIAAVAVGMVLRLPPTEMALIALTIGFVLALEAINTALEAVVDLARPSPHPLAKVAKDTAAGAVLVGAIAAVAVAALLFLPRL